LQRPEPKLRGLSSREASSLSDAYSPQEDSKAKDGPVQEMPPERREAMANMLLRSRDYESSLMNYLQVLRVQPDRMDIRYKVGVIYLLGGRYDAARQELEKVVLAKPDMLEAREALALVNVQEKRFPQALEAFRAVLRQDGQRAQTRYFLGAALLASGQPREAVTELETAIRLDPKNVAAMSSLGEAYVQLKDYPKAVAWLKKALAVDAQHQKSNHQLGMALAGLKRYDEAFQAFLKAGDEAQAYNNIGVHYYLDGRYEDAAKCFQKALELRPTYYDEAKVNLNRALEKLHQHQPKEAP
jgi:tetratricopeptide (TPR) repeat protein